MNKIFISINNQKELNGVIYTYCQDSYKIARFIEGNNNFLKKIQMRNNIIKYLKEGQSLILKEGIPCVAYLGTMKREGCSYKPEKEYYKIIAESNGTCISEAINNLEELIQKPHQYTKKIDVDLL